MNTTSLLGGTLILIAANFISKILGAVLKIPLTYILGEEGMAIYHTAFSVYVTVLLLITSGIPFSVSKYIAQCLALGREENIKKTVSISIFIMSLLGILGSLILFYGADFFALSMKDPKAALSIKAISPSVFFVATGCIYKGVFEAYQNMVPTAISQVTESLFKLALGIFFALWLSPFSAVYATSGAIFSITLGEIIATSLLFLMYLPYKNRLKHTIATKTSGAILSSIMCVAVPLMATSVISSCFSLLETSIIRNRLLDIVFTKESAEKFLFTYSQYTSIFDDVTKTLKMNIDGARWLFGSYSGYAATVFNLPVGVLASVGVSVVPTITKCVTLEDYSRLNDVLNTAIKLILISALPCAVIFYLFPDEILYILFKNTASSHILRAMSPMMIILPISGLISASLYASGKIALPFYNDTLATVLKIILSYILIKVPEINILGVVISSFIADVFLLCLNIFSAKKYLHIHLLSVSCITKTALSACAMCILCWSMKNLLQDSLFRFILVCGISAIVYLILLLLFGILKKEEIKFLQA